MKRLLITAGILLLAAVFMSGCITAPASDDPVVGIWDNQNQQEWDGVVVDNIFYVFNADGTGYSLSKFSDTPVFGKLEFTWKNEGDGKYSITLTDTKETGLPSYMEFVLAGDVLTMPLTPEIGVDLQRPSLEKYAAGLWTGGRADFNEYTNIQGLLYFHEDGTGNLVVYGPEVLNMAEVFTLDFTWDVRGDNIVFMGPKGGSFEVSLVNGDLVLAGLYPIHKYTIEDNLYGLWESAELVEENGVSYEIVQIIRFDGTGTEIWTVPGSDAATHRYPFTWKMIDSVTYEAVYEDGEVWQFTSVDTRLYDGETWYNKVGFDVLDEYAQNKVTA